MENDQIVLKLNKIYALIKEKNLDEADEKLQKLIDNTPKTEIDTHGQVLDFDNQIQFIFYCKNRNKKDIPIQWTKSYLSEMYYIKGVILFEKNKYLEAIKYHKIALKWNPVKIKSYMEILECYIKLKNVDEFYNNFITALTIALEPKDISTIYRKYAFLCIELNDYELAYNLLKYSCLIYYREENMREIDYLSSIAKVNLKKVPDIGTIQFIRNNNLEYNPNPIIAATYASQAELYESFLEKEKTSKEQELNILDNLINIYSNLYFFDCNVQTHNLKLNAIKKYMEKSKE